ncbi:MAG: hypothetical protein AB1324_01000 [Candidatus Micrarchaeota archaeon]
MKLSVLVYKEIRTPMEPCTGNGPLMRVPLHEEMSGVHYVGKLDIAKECGEQHQCEVSGKSLGELASGIGAKLRELGRKVRRLPEVSMRFKPEHAEPESIRVMAGSEAKFEVSVRRRDLGLDEISSFFREMEGVVVEDRAT